MLGTLETDIGTLKLLNNGKLLGPRFLVDIANHVPVEDYKGPSKGDWVTAWFVLIKESLVSLNISILDEKVRPFKFVENRIY